MAISKYHTRIYKAADDPPGWNYSKAFSNNFTLIINRYSHLRPELSCSQGMDEQFHPTEKHLPFINPKYTLSIKRAPQLGKIVINADGKS